MDEMAGDVRILELQYQGSTGAAVRLSLDDDSFLFLDADHAAVDIAVRFRDSADPLDETSAETLRTADEIYRCRRKAMDLLARAEQCRRGLEAKLSRKGWSRTAAAEALDRLEESGFLDDRRFAETWTRSRLRSRPEGASRLIAGLMSKGVNGSVAKEAVESVLAELGDEAGDDALKRAWRKLSRRPGITDEKLTASLLRRGFAPQSVRRLISERRDADD